jgi:hypothetical protein
LAGVLFGAGLGALETASESMISAADRPSSVSVPSALTRELFGELASTAGPLAPDASFPLLLAFVLSFGGVTMGFPFVPT